MIGIARSTRELYDDTAPRWVRKEPSALSDFTARGPLLKMCEPIAGAQVLDLGCGEGYCARYLRSRGATAVVGLDLSAGMISLARQQEAVEPLGIEFREGCATDLSAFGKASWDFVIAVFLFNYLNNEQTRGCMAEVARVLRPGGRFVFAVPHPAFPFMRSAGPPFYFNVGGAGYFSARDRSFSGRIWKRDGSSLDVQLCHKTIQDYFEALDFGGFTTLPAVREFRVTQELVEMDPAFFGPLLDMPLHLAFEVRR